MPVVPRLVPSSANDGVGVGPNDASPDAAAVSAYYEAHGYAVIAEACPTSQPSAYRLTHGIWGPVPTIADILLDVFPSGRKIQACRREDATDNAGEGPVDAIAGGGYRADPFIDGDASGTEVG